ncbi:THO complex subunit 1 transcription elongation factor-domain-containing protein [Amanita rubescens]|nr:THO complex subunit 1 transcription elongation factor-domain-containing protein [Amanita rubescens]
MTVSLQPAFTSLLDSLPPHPYGPHELGSLVRKTLDGIKSKLSPDIRKSQWEYLLRDDIFRLAATEGTALENEDNTYYDKLRDKLDLTLTFTEHDACEQTFPLSVLQDLLETQTVASCDHIFSWIECRAARLTEGMVPQKGKALVLLRTLNDLLRRLSKMGSTTIFCGRILTFLSDVFPLGERSGVNLRGEYGPTWEGVVDLTKGEKKEENEKRGLAEEKTKSDDESNKMQVDSSSSKEEFYQTFWSLQLPFSKPTIFVKKDALSEFREAVDKVLPVIKEATAKERAMMGSRAGPSSSTLKRKREPEVEETSSGDYFFAKFLTSPDLLDLEIADTHFRRQFLYQLLILLNHLLTFTKAAKTAWSSVRNRSLQMEFTLEPADAQWVQDTMNKAMEELRQTTPNGRAFADTVGMILEREKNWVKWKNELCAPFDKTPWSTDMQGRSVGLLDATAEARRKMIESPEDWPWSLGSEPLTDVWEMGYRDLQDLQMPFRAGEVKDFVKKVKQEDARIAMRKKALARAAERIAQARSKTAAASADVPMAAPDANAQTTVTSQGEAAAPPVEQPKQPVPGSTGPTPESAVSLIVPHPSLPPRPGSVPSKPGETPALPSSPPLSGQTSAPAPAPPPDPWANDEQIAKFEESKQRWSWLALRTARDQYLQLFGRIGTGDVEMLAQEIEKELEKEKIRSDEANVLVTGGAGYIGSHVIYALQKTRRYKVISLDNYHNSQPAALARISQLSWSELPKNPTPLEIQSTEIDSICCDLTKPDAIRNVFEKYGKGEIWGVVHIAAYKAVGESTEIPLTYYQNNVSATISLLQTMAEYDCTRIVYSSSATVYGTPPVIPIPESTRLQADSPYGKTKVMAETIIDDLCHADQRWRAISLRYFNPAGAHPSGMIGEDPKGRPGNLLPLLAHMAIGRVKDSTLEVFGNDYPTPDGTCVRDYLHVLDLASGHLLALDALSEGSRILDGKFGMSVLQIVEAMRKATGFDYKVRDNRRGDVPDLTADPSLAEKELGFKARQDLETMCRDLWNWQSKNPLGYGE